MPTWGNHLPYTEYKARTLLSLHKICAFHIWRQMAEIAKSEPPEPPPPLRMEHHMMRLVMSRRYNRTGERTKSLIVSIVLLSVFWWGLRMRCDYAVLFDFLSKNGRISPVPNPHRPKKNLLGSAEFDLPRLLASIPSSSPWSVQKPGLWAFPCDKWRCTKFGKCAFVCCPRGEGEGVFMHKMVINQFPSVLGGKWKTVRFSFLEPFTHSADFPHCFSFAAICSAE